MRELMFNFTLTHLVWAGEAFIALFLFMGVRASIREWKGWKKIELRNRVSNRNRCRTR
jgi:hypothetical protein